MNDRIWDSLIADLVATAWKPLLQSARAYDQREARCGSSAPDGYGTGSGAAGGSGGGNGGISRPTERVALATFPDEDGKTPPADPYTGPVANMIKNLQAIRDLTRQIQNTLYRLDNLRSTAELDNDRQCHWLGAAAYGKARNVIDGKYGCDAVKAFYITQKRTPTREECAEFIQHGKWPVIRINPSVRT